MASIRKEFVVQVPAARVWDALRDGMQARERLVTRAPAAAAMKACLERSA